VAEIQDAYKLLTPILGVGGASTLFAIALLASGQNSTLTGTLAGQIIMEGFVRIRIAPWIRRLITRMLAIIPAIVVIAIAGEGATTRLLLVSQVVLSMQLSFAVVPLVQFTENASIMGGFVNASWVRLTGWVMATMIAGLNLWLLIVQFRTGF
jgi:manganese transport protein